MHDGKPNDYLSNLIQHNLHVVTWTSQRCKSISRLLSLPLRSITLSPFSKIVHGLVEMTGSVCVTTLYATHEYSSHQSTELLQRTLLLGKSRRRRSGPSSVLFFRPSRCIPICTVCRLLCRGRGTRPGQSPSRRSKVRHRVLLKKKRWSPVPTSPFQLLGT